MATLTFLGAAGTVTGSKFLLDLDGYRVLVDCGTFQGQKANRLRNWEPFPVDPKSIQAVLLTHAHTDHTAYLPRLVKHGFNGPVYCTHSTAALCDVLLRDSAKIQEEDARWANRKKFTRHKKALPLYTLKDAERALSMFRPLHYGDTLQLTGNISARYRNAGHILGSAFIDMRVQRNGRTRKILFSGDLGRPSKPILQDPVQVFNVDYLLVESTYGDRLHNRDIDTKAELAQTINAAVNRGGALLIPAFAVGRTQSLLYTLRELEEDKAIPKLPVFVDSPMAVNATAIFAKYLAEQDLESRILAIEGVKAFQPAKLELVKSRAASKRINEVDGPAIIIASSGMVTGGRILHHLVQRMPDPRTTILFMGYQAHGTRGRKILEGHKEVKIHGRQVPVRAKVQSLSGFSGHADAHEILAWLMGFNKAPDRTFIVHGEPDSAMAMAAKIRKRFRWRVSIPKLGQRFTLDL